MFSLLLYFALIFCRHQTLQFAVFELGLDCLHMSPERISSLKGLILILMFEILTKGYF